MALSRAQRTAVARLISARELVTYPYSEFWQCMDTFKDKQVLDDLKLAEILPERCGNARPNRPPGGQCP
jgi:hypothetical protein